MALPALTGTLSGLERKAFGRRWIGIRAAGLPSLCLREPEMRAVTSGLPTSVPPPRLQAEGRNADMHKPAARPAPAKAPRSRADPEARNAGFIGRPPHCGTRVAWSPLSAWF